MSIAPGARLGAYEVLSLLGAGGMGEVYRARDTRLNRDVAIKVLPDLFAADADRLARFKREAQVLASLNHPHIAAIYGIEEGASGSALILELVEGPTLADRIAQGPIPVDEALPIALQIAEALCAAHDHGIIHRDLKPANIKLTADGQVKVLDFGLAKATDSSSVGRDFSRADLSPTITSPAMTMGGVILGTAAYMSPEQAKGKAADKRSDVWAFGCVLYEILTARRAFEGDDTSDTLAAILRGEPDWNALPADTPQPIRLLLRRCLEKDRTKRVSDVDVARFVIVDAPALQLAANPARDTVARTRLPSFIALATVCVAATAIAAWVMLARPIDVRQSIRYVIVPPASEPLLVSESDRNIAVSPDGTFVIYRVAVPGQAPHLAIRRVDQLHTTVLKGTDGARSPFVSTDGRWVGFWSAGELKKISASGGPAVTLCRSAYVIRGASWGEDDTIVFASSDPQTGLFRVPATGGEPEILTKVEPGKGDHLSPSWLPGSDRVLFSASTTLQSGAPSEIIALDLKTGARTVLLQSGTQPVYVESGHLVYASSGALHAARFDLSTAAVLGPPVPVVEQVLTATNGSSNYAVSRNGTLAYVPGEATVARRALAWIDRQGREEVVKGPLRGFADPRLSPDAQRIALEITEDGDDIWTLDLARGALEKKTFEPGEDETAVWSPDGRWVAYSSTRGNDRSVIRRRADGSGPEERLWSAPVGSVHVHVEEWMRDGRALLIAMAEANGAPADIALLPLEGAHTPTPLLRTPFSERGARVSPDSRWLAYTSNESGRDEVYVRPFPSLDGKWQVSTGGGSQPVWSAKGDELFYRSDAMMAVRITPGASFIPATPQRLFEDSLHTKGAGHTGYDVSPDGRRFLMISTGGSFLSNTAAATINVVVNWFDELKVRTPAK